MILDAAEDLRAVGIRQIKNDHTKALAATAAQRTGKKIGPVSESAGHLADVRAGGRRDTLRGRSII